MHPDIWCVLLGLSTVFVSMDSYTVFDAYFLPYIRRAYVHAGLPIPNCESTFDERSSQHLQIPTFYDTIHWTGDLVHISQHNDLHVAVGSQYFRVFWRFVMRTCDGHWHCLHLHWLEFEQKAEQRQTVSD